MSIKKTQAILKCFIDLLAFGFRWAQKTKPCFVTPCFVNFTAVDRSLTAVCGRDASGKNSHASQLSTNNPQPSGNCMKTKTFKGILREETAVNFLKGKKFKVILPDF